MTLGSLFDGIAGFPLAGTAIIYSLGANESPKGRRVFFGIPGVAMIIAFVCACVFFHKYGVPL